jgi:hypothetical protein
MTATRLFQAPRGHPGLLRPPRLQRAHRGDQRPPRSTTPQPRDSEISPTTAGARYRTAAHCTHSSMHSELRRATKRRTDIPTTPLPRDIHRRGHFQHARPHGRGCHRDPRSTATGGANGWVLIAEIPPCRPSCVTRLLKCYGSNPEGN